MFTTNKEISAIEILEDAYIKGQVSRDDFFKALDTSNLVKKKITDKNGKTTTKWVKRDEDDVVNNSKSKEEEKGKKTTKQKVEKEPEKISDEDLAKFAKQTSDEDLERHSKGADEKMRIAAKKELESRKTEHEEVGKKPQKKGDKFGNLSPESAKNLKKFRSEVIKNIETISDFFEKEVGEIGFEDLIDAIGGFKPEYEKFECRMRVLRNRISFEMECDGYRCEREFMKVRVKRSDETEIVLHNEVLKVAETGKGLGVEIMDSQIQKCKDLGVKKMTCYAAGDKQAYMNGYYTWGRVGYTMTSDDDKRFLHDLLEMNSLPKTSLSELLLTEKGREFWKENGFPFEAQFDLSDNSTSMKIFNNYKKFKNASK